MVPFGVGLKLGYSEGVAPSVRPPGFAMTYRPQEVAFGPPMSARIPSFIYLGIALVGVTLLVSGEASAPGSALRTYVVDEDVHRLIHARTFVIVLVISAIASIARAGMRGVRVYADGLECRDVIGWLWPKITRFRWAQIDGVILLANQRVALDLWDGSHVTLPRVQDPDGLVNRLEKIASIESIPFQGGEGLDEVIERELDS